MGLMRNLDIIAFENCIRQEYGFGADSFFTMCLWQASPSTSALFYIMAD